MKMNRNCKPWNPGLRKILFLMRLLSLFVTGMTMHLSASVYSQNVMFNFKLRNATFEDLMGEVRRYSDYFFVYKDTDVAGIKRLTREFKEAGIEEVLQGCLEGSGLTFFIEDNLIYIKLADKTTDRESLPQQESKKATGIVTDEEGNPLPGVSVIVSGTRVGVSTDANGRFEIQYSGGLKEVKLEFSFIGMKSQILLYKGKELRVTMEENSYELDAVNIVETGYQTIDRRHLTSAVTSVRAEDILIPGMTSIDQALEGRIPDLMLLNTSGTVGATPRIRVRGTSTIIGNRNPLWVLDGVVLTDPVDVDPEELNNPDYINIIGNAIAGVNPQDIERIDVLKDASATALYGTQAANGVIVVTTKRYSHASKITRRPRYTDKEIYLMNSQERMQFGKDLVDSRYFFPENMTMVGYEGAYYNWVTGKTNYDEFLKEVQHFETVNTDWFDLLTRDSYSHIHTFSFSGGSDAIRYYTSFGISEDNGVEKTSFSDRYTVMVNLDAKISKKFNASLRVNGNVLNKNHIPGEVNVIEYAYNTTRTLPAFKENGTYYYYKKNNDLNTPLNYNILNEIDNSSREYKGNTVMGTLDLRFTPTDWWNINGMFSYTRSNTRQEDWWGEKSWYASSLRNAEYGQTPPSYNCFLPYGGILKSTITDMESKTMRIQSNISKYIDEAQFHLVASSLGFEVTSDRNLTILDENRGYLKDRGKQFVDMSSGSLKDEGGYLVDDYPQFKEWLAKPHRRLSENLSNSISGYLTLSYVNGRFDLSNKFGSESNNRLLPVWSVSGMANLKEIFYAHRFAGDFDAKDKFWLTEARLRLSFGQQGNMIDGETPHMLLNQGAIDPYYGEYVSTLYKLPNPNLKWEVTNQTNIGLDLSFWQGRLNAGLEVYLKKTHDLISPVKVASVNGVPDGTYNMNNGDMSNKGLSITLSGYPIRRKDFKWYASTYYSVNLNKVQTEPVEKYSMYDFLNGYAVIDGKPISTFYSYKYLGLDPKTGVPLFDDWQDRQHLLLGKTVANVIMTVLEDSGCRDPFISGSLNNNVSWKNWNLSFNLYYSLGSKIRLFEMYESINDGVSSINNVRKEFVNRWMVPGDEKRTDYPVLLSPSDPNYSKYKTHWSYGTDITFAEDIWQMYDQSSVRVVSGNYLKLQSLNLRYNFSDKVLRKTPFSSLSVSFATQNLFTISSKALKGQAPTQSGFADPQLSVRPTYTFNVNVSF